MNPHSATPEQKLKELFGGLITCGPEHDPKTAALQLAASIPGFKWERRNQPSELCRGEVHIWLIELDAEPDLLNAWRGTLSEDEQRKANRFHFARDRNRYIAGRGQLRELLATYLEITPAEVHFAYGPSGKPKLAESSDASKVHFNLSHCENIALLGVTYDAEIGTDIERVRKVQDRDLVAKYFFAPREFDRLMGIADSHSEEAFFRCWTRKEAFLKARGTGITEGLHAFEVDFADERRASFTAMKPEFGAISDWSLEAIHLGAGWTGAVAVCTPQINTHCWRYLRSPWGIAR